MSRIRFPRLLLSILLLIAIWSPAFAVDDQDVAGRPQTIVDDLLLSGSLCIGLDSPVDTLDFGYSTIVLRENNLRIHFDDTSSSASFPAQDWCLVANDSENGGDNYFAIVDSTACTAPFKVMGGAPTHACVIAPTGDVGLGTPEPQAQLHVTSAAPSIGVSVAGDDVFVFEVQPTGDVIIAGHVMESSSREAKENFVPVDGAAVLDRVADLPVYEWTYKNGDPDRTHLGPVAEEFAARFGLGDDKHISPSDMAGVALGAVKALRAENEALKARLAAMEAAVAKLTAQSQ